VKVKNEARLQTYVEKVQARLTRFYGPPPPLQPGDPLVGLISTMLSQHTSDLNSERAMSVLLDRFRDFESVLDAPIEEIEGAIRVGGLATVKARRIKRVLEEIKRDHGTLSLDFLVELSLAEARGYLTSLAGVGPKTAACVLLFDCGRPAIPVDTHVHRVSRRLGLIGSKVSADRAHGELERLVPTEQAYQFHVNLIRHGREICKARQPRCPVCPLDDCCPKVGVAPSATLERRAITSSGRRA